MTQYSYGHDLISQRRWSNGQWTTHFMGYDGHGSVRFLTDVNGNVTDTLDYDAFGILVDRTGNTPLNYMYAGEQWDADLQMYYNRARYLNVNTGRFWSQDSYEGNSYDPSSLHKYTYATNNSINNLDPSGNITLKEAAISFGISVALSTISGAVVGGIRNGIQGAIDGAAQGFVISSIVTGAVIGGAVAVEAAAGVAISGAFVIITSKALGSIFAALGIYDLIQARSRREKIAAAVSLLILVAGTAYGSGKSATPAQLYADIVRGNTTKATRPATVAILETTKQTIRGHAGFQDPVNNVVQYHLDNLPPSVLNAAKASGAASHAGKCAETQCLSNAFNNNINPSGGRISTAKVRGSNSANHGSPHKPCEICEYLLDVFEVEYYEP